MNTPLMQAPYLREQRQFPFDNLDQLARQVDHAYIDIASKVNVRVIGTYAVNDPIVTGKRWFLKGQPKKQQTLRQVYTFNAAGNIPHGINFASITQFTECSGVFTDNINWYGVIFGSNVAIAGQVSFYITANDIVVIDGGAPPIMSGTIILEWLSQF